RPCRPGARADRIGGPGWAADRRGRVRDRRRLDRAAPRDRDQRAERADVLPRIPGHVPRDGGAPLSPLQGGPEERRLGATGAAAAPSAAAAPRARRSARRGFASTAEASPI